MAKYDVNLIVVGEKDVIIRDDKIIISGEKTQCRLFVDFPFLFYNQALNDLLARLYHQGEINFLIPPKPFLGSKALLALLRNDTENETLEAILRSQISCHALECLRQHIPETYFIGKRTKEDLSENKYNGRRFVLKETISSGMKGTTFGDEKHFAAMMQLAQKSCYQFVLQEEVTNDAQMFEYFDGDGEICRDNWFMRITAHYAIGHIADIVITARRDKKVHGALDCLQLGTIIV